MTLLKWIPWRFFVTRVARANGFLDPISFLSKLRGFAQPSEVSEPVELLRAGVLFHARGLINTKAIQNNLDWVWPYWVERQFNPSDLSFIPRAFSFSHINLTHRNWTAVGLPDVPFYPIVDPRGLVTAIYDGWSVDFWLVARDGRKLIPSKLESVGQKIYRKDQDNLHIQTVCEEHGWTLQSDVWMQLLDHRPTCVIDLEVKSEPDCDLVVVIRPYNPEGISFIEKISLKAGSASWMVNEKDKVFFSEAPGRCVLANYKDGDVLHLLKESVHREEISCPVSMATGAALYHLDTGRKKLQIRIPVLDELEWGKTPVVERTPDWTKEIATFSRLQVPDATILNLYDTAVTSVIMHCGDEVYPGPYTYKRFWYRDAAFILNSVISLGAVDRARNSLRIFPEKQNRAGYFLSQEGEWDSNGEALWIMHRFWKLSREPLSDIWLQSIEKGARWIIKKRLPRDLDSPHAGLLPAGFSAEHLGPNDYYYWDNFWGVAGLRCAAEMLENSNGPVAAEFRAVADEYLETIQKSFKKIPDREARGSISASPHRRMDAGAIGSIVADFPLQLYPAGETRLMKTLDWLYDHSCFEGGFFQNMIHSGINAYLTLHMAQVYLRARNPRMWGLIDTVARLASPTGQWPEAIHPQTKGGCMGDGQHVWAAAEWLMMIRNLFVREENNGLVLGSGLFPRWLQSGGALHFGPTLTPFGKLSVTFEPQTPDGIALKLTADWFDKRPPIEVAVPGFESFQIKTDDLVFVMKPAL